MNVETAMEKITEMSVAYAPRILMAILTLIIGFWIIGKIVGMLSKALERNGMDLSLVRFLSSIARVGLKVMVLLSVAGMFGVNTTSFVAILAALMVGVGMAMNGSLGHLASGIMIMLFKPFKVGDAVIIGGGHRGKVEAINAFYTTLETPENRRIIVANANVTGDSITNISGQGTTGVLMTFGIGYGDDIDKAREIILRIGKACPLIIDEPAQAVVVAELADSSVNLKTRPFCKSEHYWDVYFYMQENVKKTFDNEGIGIPFPQMDVHMINN